MNAVIAGVTRSIGGRSVRKRMVMLCSGRSQGVELASETEDAFVDILLLLCRV